MANTANFGWPIIESGEELADSFTKLSSFQTEVDAEVAGVSAALNSKAPKANPTFTGTVTLPVVSADDNSQKAAPTKFVQDIAKDIRDNPQGAAVQLVAFGAVADGDFVALRSDGKVEKVAGTVTATAVGSPNLIHASAESDIVYEPVSGNLVAWSAWTAAGNSTIAEMRTLVGTISGSTISWQAAVAPIPLQYGTKPFACVYGNSQKILLIYKDEDASLHRMIVATLSGTTLTFGSPVTLVNNVFSNSYVVSAVYHAASDRILVTYANSGTLYVAAVSISGTVPSLGTAVVLSNTGTGWADVTVLGNGTIVAQKFESPTGSFAVCTISGSTITLGSWTNLSLAFVQHLWPLSGGFFVAARQAGAASELFLVEWNGTAFSVVATYSYDVYSLGTSGNARLIFDSASSRFALTYADVTTQHWKTKIGKFANGVLTFEPTDRLISANAASGLRGCLVGHLGKPVAVAHYGAGSQYSVITLPAYSGNYGEWIGIADGAAIDGANVKVQLPGAVDDARTGLTAGSFYYLTPTGTMTSTKTTYFDGVEDRPIGRALSSSRLLIEASNGTSAKQLGLTIGETVQAWDAMLDAIAALDSSAGKFLAFSGKNAPVLRNILGTVTMYSGLPTGAIVERGSNANGEYVRFADGTQICHGAGGVNVASNTATGSGYATASFSTWTFPAAFASLSNLVVSGMAAVGGRWVSFDNVTTTSVDFRHNSFLSNGTNWGTRIMAIGRWTQ